MWNFSQFIVRAGVFLSVLNLTACVYFTPTLIKDQDVFLFQGKERIIVSFSSVKQETKENLQYTALSIDYLLKQLPQELQNEKFFIEGLIGENFSDFFTIADTLFFSTSEFHNKMLIYGYISSLYEKFMISHKKYPFIPLMDFEKLFYTNTISMKENDLLTAESVQYSIDDIFFVSILELLERPDRYFYPLKTREELFRVLIFPEILSFWKYMESRFGKKMLINSSKNKYTPEEFHVQFGEKISDLESNYLKLVKEKLKKSTILKNQQMLEQFTNTLNLYMSGTKRSLMSE